MSNMLRRFKKDKTDYKTLYETELNNRKKYEKRYREKCRENIQLQKETGIADLRKEMMKLQDEIAFLKEDRSLLYVQLEDARNELQKYKDKKKTSSKKKKESEKVGE